MSFFSQFSLPGAKPIAQEKHVVKIVRATKLQPSDRPSPASNSNIIKKKFPENCKTGKATLEVPDSRPRSRASSAVSLKRKHVDGDRLVKRASSSDLLKPPSPESGASPTGRRAVSSSRSPLSQRLESSDEEEEESSDEERGRRAIKRTKAEEDSVIGNGRKLVNPASFRKASPTRKLEEGHFIHAETIANMGMKEGGKGPSRIFRKSDQKLLSVKLQYPGVTYPERYELVRLAEPDEFSPDLDILNTAEHVAKYLLTPPESDELLTGTLSSNSSGIVYNMRRAIRNEKAQDFLDHLNKYNNLIARYRRDGTIKANIARMKTLPFPLVEHILSQAYARTVAPEVESLKDYEAFTSNVYGELLPNFTTKLFKESGLGPDKVFVDLGSGTGNVVLHAALETGCEAYGCEIMKNATRLADKQKMEFAARCRMWGINPGKFRLEKGDFLESARIAEALKRADVVLVNNYVFDSELNQRLLNLFLDLKEGAQILSLKPFVPTNHVITTRNAENPVSRLRVEEKEYFSGSVSWTDTGGKYYVQTVDGSMLREFLASDRSDRRRR